MLPALVSPSSVSTASLSGVKSALTASHHAIEPNVGVPMREHIAEVADLAPRNLGVAGLDYFGQVVRSVGECFHATEHGVLCAAVLVKEITIRGTARTCEILLD